MKLELKHLAPYLPYNVGYTHKYLDLNVTYGELDTKNIIELINPSTNHCIILRPLSDLTEDIVIGNVKFIPIDILFEKEHPRHLSKRYYSETFYNYASVSHNGTAVNLKVYLGKIIEQNPRWIFEYLLRWHFDVFGLIEKGLAIDINTIE